jgi:hypothetical protein
MSFKAQLEKDITGVFINPSEFATEHNVDGTLVDCVVDDDIINERTGLDSNLEYDGVFVVKKMLYIKESFFSKKPLEGQRIDLDGDYHYVKNVSTNIGMLEIELERNDT